MELELSHLIMESRRFSMQQSAQDEPSIFGVTDGKAVGTFFEHRFKEYLSSRYSFHQGNSSSGIDFPSIETDMKVTSKKNPQSSCPYKSARQKIYGLGYNLIVFVYDKIDDPLKATSRLLIQDSVYIKAERTADYQTTRGIIEMLDKQANRDDIAGFLIERNLLVDEIELFTLSEEILRNPPLLGYLTISNALQWRLQYSRVIECAGTVEGITTIYSSTQEIN